MKGCDGQITVGFDRGDEQKLSLDGNLRRRTSLVRVNVWAVDKPDQKYGGRASRDKINAEVLRVVREKRSKPNVIDYNYVGVGRLTDAHRAFHSASQSELSPLSSEWTELTDAEYLKLWYGDGDRFSKSTNENGKFPFMLFRFKLDADPKVVHELTLEFKGYGSSPNGNGATIKVWNHKLGAWEHAVTGSGESDETLAATITSDLADHICDNCYVFLLAKTANPSNGSAGAILHCDTAEITFTVSGITYADVVAARDMDEVRVKPFLWRTEFTVKTWSFENVPVT